MLRNKKALVSEKTTFLIDLPFYYPDNFLGFLSNVMFG